MAQKRKNNEKLKTKTE